MGAYELIELDIYAYVACYKMIEWIEWLVIKFELIWMNMNMRLILVSGLNGYMSCESIQTSWSQVWFNLKKYSSSDWNVSYIVKSKCAVILAMFERSNLFGLASNLVCIL